VRSQIEIDDDDEAVTQISEAEFHECEREVQQAIDTWLSAASFAAIDRQLQTHHNDGSVEYQDFGDFRRLARH
jgi:hypothetical protein